MSADTQSYRAIAARRGPLDKPIPLTLDDTDPSAFAARLGDDLTRYGFATIAEHGISEPSIAAADRAARAFFALPDSVKRRYHRPGSGGARGFTSFGIETAKGAAHHDLKEFWHTGPDLPAGSPLGAMMPPNLWPEEIVGFRPSITALFDAFDALGRRLLRAIACYLGLASDFFDQPTAEGNSVLRLLHYPPVIDASIHQRAAPHEDINVITLLLGAEEAGLELLDKNGRWLPVHPPAGAIVVNIADMLQRLTNHILPSTTHRVVNPSSARAGMSRYSMPFFLHFRPDYQIRTLPSCIGPTRPDRYPESITADAYLQQRLAEIKLA